ncbi:putative aminoacrylate hydrolase RutD [Enhygromyxa salina]|uniref:Putative aminoacrylate hydrolase RutD n=1 Tax=Enhygromyxa salina TaxID=215803 RepID=A0A2S9YLC0_9BACT|nr:alpha/beta hydrolase [Enhygromyxa salina]PRQ05832.1 putative aminoacrylate hydrolase RutD [Enhygromyxa salina]
MTLELPHLRLPGQPGHVPLVVLLGLPSRLESSRRLLEAIAGPRPLLAVTPTGPGASASSSIGWDELVAWLEACALSQGFERFDLLGWSFGGAWALQLLARHPARVRRAVVAVTCAHFRARERALFRLVQGVLDAAIDERTLIEGMVPMLFSPGFLHRPGVFATLAMHLGQLSTSRPQWAAQLARLASHDLRASVPTMTALHTVIAGDQDWLFPASEVRRLADAAPAATFAELPSGHAIWFEAEAAFVALVQRAFAQPDPDPHLDPHLDLRGDA